MESYKKLMMSVAAIAAGFAAFAAEIAFTGGGDGTSRDLSLAANWDGGELPGADDVGVVDIAAFGASYTIGDDAAIGGVRFANVSKETTLEGERTLTLGAGGFTVIGTGGFVLRAPLATSAVQTWNFGGGKLTTWSTVAGTSALTIKNASEVNHREALAYGGDVTYSSAPVKVHRPGPWAKSLVSSSAVWFMPSNTLEFVASELFSSGSFQCTAWDPNTEFVASDLNATRGTFLFDSGTWDMRGVGFSIGAGVVRQTGGTIDVTQGNACTFFVGDYKAYGAGGKSWGTWPATFELEDGVLKANEIMLGMYYSSVTTPAGFLQKGGDVTCGGLGIGGGHQSKAYAWGEYVMGAGTLDVGVKNTKAQRGIALFARGGQGSESPGVYTQTGGVANVYRVMWGSTHDSILGAVSATNNTGYGRFDLCGGTFNLGAGGFMTHLWNTSSTNAGYQISLKGGTLATAADQTGTMKWTLPPSDTSFTFSTDNQYALQAPVDGVGTLRKTGSGTLTLTDATRFRGTVSVEEGTLALQGGVIGDDTEGALVWSGDDMVGRQGLATNVALVGFTDTSDTLTFTNWPAAEGSATTPSKPKLEQLPNQFNGHASMLLDYSYLGLAKEDNPLNGATNFTCAFVFRISQGDLCCTENQDWAWAYTSGLLGHASSMSFTLSHTRDGNLTSTPRFVVGMYMNGNAQYFSEPDYNMNDNRAHVVVVSVSNNVVSITGDGYACDNVKTDAPASTWPRFKNLPLLMGSPLVSKLNSGNNYIHNCRIAEMRIYPNRALSESERFRVGHALATKYGVNTLALARYGSCGGKMVADAAPASVPSTDYVWEADDLNGLEDGAEVESWPVSGTDEGRYKVTKSPNSPTLVKNAVNGHSVVRFESGGKSALRGDSPIKGLKSWAAAVVFVSTNGDSLGTGQVGASYENTSGEGIFGCRTYGWNDSQMGIAWHKEGSLLVSFDGADRNYFWSRNPFRLHDGLPHVVIITCDGTDGRYRYLIDGRQVATGTKTAAVQAVSYLNFGRLHNQNNNYGFFTGDIAAARLYTRALTLDECTTLSEHYLQRFGMQPCGTVPYALGDVRAFGLGATNVTVAAGATLRLPLTSENPYTVKGGVTLAGAGKIEGTVRYGEGSVYDLAASMPQIEAIELKDCMIKAAAEAADGSNIASVSGTITIDPAAVMAKGKTKNPVLVNVAPEAVDSEVVFEIPDSDPRLIYGEYDAETRSIRIRRRFSTVIIVR